MVATDHQVGDHVLVTEQGHLEGGNRQGPDPALGAVLVKGSITHTQDRTRGREVHPEIKSKVA